MIEFGNAVACGDRHLPIDFSPQLSHLSRKVFQFARPPVRSPNRLRWRPANSNGAGSGLKFAPLPSSIGGMRCFRQGGAALMLSALCSLAAGCSIPTIGLADRCADVMR